MPSGSVTPDQKQSVIDYLYQIFMRNGTTEYAPMINFNQTLQAYIPLGTSRKLANKNFDVPISFIYGDNDWVLDIEEDIADIVTLSNKFAGKTDEEEGLQISKVHIVPTSDHNMHMDNPKALANILINDIYNLGLEVASNPKNSQFFDCKTDGSLEDRKFCI